MKTIIRFAIVVVLMAGMILTRPTKKEFVDWYVNKNYAEDAEIIKGTMEQIVNAETDASDYLLFSVFEIEEKDRYIGIAGMIIGRSSVQDAKDTLEQIIDEASRAMESSK